MNISTTTHSGRRGRSMTVVLAATMALALPASALAQDPTENQAQSLAAEAASSEVPFPVMLGGELLTTESYTGPEWLAQFPDDPAFVERTEALVTRDGATIDDLTVKSALYQPLPPQEFGFELDPGLEGEAEQPLLDVISEPPAVVAAMQVAGVDARVWVEEAVDLMVGDIVEPGLVLRPLGTKWTLRVTDATMPGVYPRTVYLKDDVAWIIQGENDYVIDALSQLPDPEPVGLSSADSLYLDVPLALGDQRRIGLYESTEPLFLPTLGERLGENIEQWLLDLYLEAGISPAEMLGVIAWWGLEAAQDGIQIEGYRLPEGGEELTQQLLDDIFLVRPPEVSTDPDAPTAELDGIAAQLEGVIFSEEVIADQAVAVLDYDTAKQYIYSTADTIWVISDPLGEPEKVQEAIEALPRG